jgi:Na+/melibiose symporter-like transporter
MKQYEVFKSECIKQVRKFIHNVKILVHLLLFNYPWGFFSLSLSFFFFFVYILDCEAIDTAATPGLLCQPQVIVKMIVEKQMECRLAGETEALRENLPQRHFCPSQDST